MLQLWNCVEVEGRDGVPGVDPELLNNAHFRMYILMKEIYRQSLIINLLSIQIDKFEITKD